MNDLSLLEVNNLSITIREAAVVRDVSFKIDTGKSLGIVGESGCGKSLTALSIMRLLSQPPMKIAQGEVLFESQNLLTMGEKNLEKIRGKDIAMIFQEPMTSLNPVFSVGSQVAEVLYLHEGRNKHDVQRKTEELFEIVGLSTSRIASRFPHQLSGGQRQRVMIAMALACQPKLLIADEPTTALDVTVQAQILELIDDLRKEFNMAILLIAHDLGIVRHHCDHVAVMYAGQIVESGPSSQVFLTPSHPYTSALLETIPAVNKPGKPLPSIEGTVPAPTVEHKGCAFAPRCQRVQQNCLDELPNLLQIENQQQQVRCWHAIRAS